MIKDLFLSLFQPKNNNLSDRDDVNLLLPELPFYGVGGTICRIEEAPECYYKILYNPDGTINFDRKPVPKKKSKNLNSILNDYYIDLKKYLDTFSYKYLEYKKVEYNPVLTDKQFYALAVVTFLATVASIPFIFSTAWVGFVFGTISAFSLYMVCDIHKKDVRQIRERSLFKKQYEQCQRSLADYRANNALGKEKTLSTVYTEIEAKGKIRDKDNPKIKVLVKEENVEAA